jgi:uncharacterized protein YbjT (DUF2867 family)
VTGDVFERADLLRAFDGVDVAYYLVHSMSGNPRDFAASDRIAAELFATTAREAGVKRIIYLGGLGVDGANLSHHLRSRHEVGEILRSAGVPVTEFRAAVIVGSGSASFEMMRYLTERLPIMIGPKWVNTRCQPIAIRDVLAYLVEELQLERTGSVVREIGGADVLTYSEMMLRYARIRGLARHIVVVPFFTPRLSSAWVHLVTPIPSAIARPLIDGLLNEVIVHNHEADAEFPDIHPLGYDEAVTRALDRSTLIGPQTTWFDAFDARTLPGEFAGLSEGMLIDRREHSSSAAPREVARVFSELGGKRGWLYADFLWELRGLLDRMVGGFGMRRGRRSATDLARGRCRGLLARRGLGSRRPAQAARRNATARKGLAAIRGRPRGVRRFDAAPDGVLRTARHLRLPLLVRRLALPLVYLRQHGPPHRAGGRAGAPSCRR